jgi:hypothetical protein
MKPTKPKPLRGTPLARAALTYIHENPDLWKQNYSPRLHSSCGCFIHHVLVIGGAKTNEQIVFYRQTASELLETSWHSVCLLYSARNTLSDLNRLCKKIFGIKRLRLKNGKVVVL